MANVKITDLTAYTDPLNTDVLAIVDVTNNVTKKVSIANMAKNVSLGTAALPGVAFDGDPNTGIYSPGADQLAISTGGTSRLAVSTTAVSSTLAVDVPLGAVGTPSITFTGDLNTGLFSPGADTLALVTGGTNRVHVTSGGLVGIGTTPAAGSLLHINSAASTDCKQQISVTTSTQAAYTAYVSTVVSTVGTENSTGGSLMSGSGPYATVISNGGAYPINFGTNNTIRATIDSSGRLLVGTSDGSGGVSKLVVQGASNGSAVGVAQISYNGLSSAVLAADTDIGYLRFTDQGSSSGVFAQITASTDGTTGASDHPGRLVFSTTADGAASPTERMRIGQNGNVRIGRTTSYVDERLVVANTLNQTNASMVQDYNGNVANLVLFHAYARVAQSAVQIWFQDFNGSNVGYISNNTVSVSYNTTSDYRLKENVRPTVDGITRLLQLKPSRFNFKADPDTVVDGFLAHEVQDVVPEAIQGTKDEVDADGKPVMQGIDQSKLVPLLTAALQEAIARIETLEANNADMLARLTALEAA